MTISVTRALALAFPLLLTATASPARAIVRSRSEDPRALVAYSRALDEYVRLRRTLEWWVLPDEGIAGERVGATDIVAARMRDARRHARQGDVFTPAVERAFRVRIDQALQTGAEDEGEDLPLIAIWEDHPRPEVNGGLPAHAGERTWTSRIPELPPLPDVLEYRFVGRHLVLLDPELDVIVDVLPDAFAPRLHGRP